MSSWGPSVVCGVKSKKNYHVGRMKTVDSGTGRVCPVVLCVCILFLVIGLYFAFNPGEDGVKR